MRTEQHASLVDWQDAKEGLTDPQPAAAPPQPHRRHLAFKNTGQMSIYQVGPATLQEYACSTSPRFLPCPND